MYLQENEITTKKISEIFSGAFLEVTEIKDNGFSVTGPDSVITTRILNNPERKEIYFSHHNGMERITEQEAALICNKINGAITLVRFYASTWGNGQIVVSSEYQMTYEKGLIPFQVMANLRLFEKVVPHVLRTHFENHI